MPVAREKGGRRRTASNSSDCGQQQFQSPPRPRLFNMDFEPNDGDMVQDMGDPLNQHCCSPKCVVLMEVVDQLGADAELVKMICSNDKCPFNPFMHGACFSAFEEQMLSFLRGMSRARNWTEKERRQNLWTKKGYNLIFKVSTCRCAKGALRRDLSYNGGVGGGGGGGMEGSEKGKRKRKKSGSGERVTVPIRASNGPQRARSRTTCRSNSDSMSSENGIGMSSAPSILTGISAFMQPFAHRSDYKVFEKLVPRHLVNSYHIKMEDDGYGAGDDTRSFVLSSLAHHRTSYVGCVLCAGRMIVYDQFPLIDGTFFISPLKLNSSALLVESKDDSSSYLTAICIRCLVGSHKVTCTYCATPWNGNAHQIGTMYSYDLFASCPCCAASLQCNKCRHPLAEPKHLTYSFSQLSAKHKCGNCSCEDFHFVKPISRFHVSGDGK